MWRSVGPSQRVCSRLDVGQHLHGRADHAGRVVAAAEPRLHRGDLDPGAGQLPVGRGGEHLELGHAVVGLERAIHQRSGLARRAPTAAANRSSGTGRPPTSTRSAHEREVRRQVRAGLQAVALQQGGDHPDGRRLSVGAQHVNRAKALVRRIEHGHQPPHALQPEAHPEHLERVEVALGIAHRARGANSVRIRQLSYSSSSASSASKRSSFSRSLCTSCGGALSVNPLLASFPRARSISARNRFALGVDPGARLLRVDRVARQHLDGRALEADRADHLSVAAVGR